uniref:Uncharacterized protein n=1 Tax=Junco hyemalis TaxID=40217 RepID=A0A8C5NRP2_JUNHY
MGTGAGGDRERRGQPLWPAGDRRGQGPWGRRGQLRAPPREGTGAVPSAPRPFNQVPGDWRAGWLNLYRFWREGGLSNLHLSMHPDLGGLAL